MGAVQGAASTGTLLASLVLYAPLSRALGQERLFALGCACNALGYPWAAVLTATGLAQTGSSSSGGGDGGVAVGVILAGNFVNAMGWEFCFTSANLMIKNTVAPQHIGRAMGMGNTAVACGIAVGPVLGASLFALSVAPDFGGGPLSEGRLFFLVVELLLLANIACTWRWLVPRKEAAAMIGEEDRAQALLAIN